jgi:hypothetical protein
VSELWRTAREAVAALAAADPALRRFGAARHRYRLDPPLDADARAAIERRIGPLPDDVGELAGQLAAGGAGPGYGLVPLDRAAHVTGAPAAAGPAWTRGLPVADLGCGYAAVVALDGPARGEVWIDARAIGVVALIHASLTAFYLDWIDRLAHARWPDAHVATGVCALASALSGYLGHCEAERDLPPGSLAGEPLREALSRLGPASIRVTAVSSVWFAPDDLVDPCLACARLLDNLAADGLRGDVVAPGLPPVPMRL